MTVRIPVYAPVADNGPVSIRRNVAGLYAKWVPLIEKLFALKNSFGSANTKTDDFLILPD